jgi:hypothetical protein
MDGGAFCAGPLDMHRFLCYYGKDSKSIAIEEFINE